MATEISTGEGAIGKAPKTYFCAPKDVSISYVQTDSIARLQEDINRIPTVEPMKFDWLSFFIGIIPSMLVGLFCEWNISSRNSIIYLVALIVAATAAIYFACKKGNDNASIKIVNERVQTVRTDLSYISKQINSPENQSSESSISGS